MAESIRFDFLSTGADRLARDFKNTGDNAAAAARGAAVLQDIIGKLGPKEERTAAQSQLLARALRQTGDAEDRMAAKAVAADAAIRRLDDAMQKEERDALEAAAANRVLGDSFDSLADRVGPSGLRGALVALAPALVPLTAGIVPAVGASLGAATVAAGLFGAVAGSVLSKASENLTKLQQLEQKANSARTADQKKAAEQQIAALKATWSSGYLDMLGALEDFKGDWQRTTQQIAVPALTAGIKALDAGIGFLKPALAPVAALFTSWGQAIDRYFRSRAGSDEVGRLASAFGRFSADQLSALGVFLTDIGRGVFNLGRDLAAHNVDFGAFATYLDQWGGAFERWSRSAAARQDVNRFLAYLQANGPVVKDLVKNLGDVLAVFAPGLSSLGQLELRLITDFLGFLARIPKSIATPLIETAGALLLLQKVGLLKVGIKLVGAGVKLLTGGAVSIGGGAAAAGEIRAAFASGGAAAAAEIRAALATGGAAAGAGGAVTGGGAAGAAAGKAAAGGFAVAFRAALTPALAGVVVGAVIRSVGDSLSPAGSFAGKLNANFQADGHLWSTSLLHSFTFGGLEGWLSAKFGIPVGGFINSTLARLGGASAKANQQVQSDFGRTGQAADVAKAKLGDFAGVMQDRVAKAMAAAGTHADALRISHLGPLGSKVDSVTRQTGIMQGAIADPSRVAAGGAHADTFRNSHLAPLQSKISNVTRQMGIMQGTINSLHGKTVDVGVHGSGSGGARITVSSVGGGAFAGKLVAISNRALGGFITGGIAGRDSVPGMLMPGELVVPTSMVRAGAVDHLRGMLPGFAAGGLVNPAPFVTRTEGSYSADSKGAIGAEASAAFKAVVAAVTAALRAQAQAAAASAGVPGAQGGPASASAAQAQAYARSRLGAYGWGASQMPSLIALWNGECVPLRVRILTRRGWLAYDEVQVGDETIGYNPETGRSEWTRITAVHKFGPTPVKRFGNQYWSAESTANHRWLAEDMGTRYRYGPRPERVVLERQEVITGEGLVELRDLRKSQRVVLSRPAHSDSALPVSIREAALLGWIAGDGSVSESREYRYDRKPDLPPSDEAPFGYRRDGRPKKNRSGAPRKSGPRRSMSGLMVKITQAKSEHFDAIDEACASDPGCGRGVERAKVDGHRDVRVWRLSAAYSRHLLARAGNPKTDSVAQVLAMSDEQRAAWLDAITAAEGTRKGNRVMIYQDDGPIADAIELAIYLSGHRPSRSKDSRNNKLAWHIYPASPHVGGIGRRRFIEDAGVQEVWCPTTELGSWTANQDGQVFLTGNSGWNRLARNPTSGAYGIPQALPPGKMGAAANPPTSSAAAQINWGMGYIRSVYQTPSSAYSRWLGRSPHWYARGGLVPGYATGGTVASKGAAWLKAWQTKHGGGFGAAWGPVVVNEQIARMSAAIGRAKALASASGLSAGQHRFWASAAADETRRLGVLKSELTTERAWRTQLGVNELALDKEIKAAGGLPSLAGAVRGWKTQMGRDKATVAAISAMLGYSDAQRAALAKAAGPKLPPVTHTYGGDVADTIAPILASALAPVTMDSGGWLRPGLTAVYNGTGRPEAVMPPARGGTAGGGGVLQLEITGGDQELVTLLRKIVKVKGGGNVQAALGSR